MGDSLGAEVGATVGFGVGVSVGEQSKRLTVNAAQSVQIADGGKVNVFKLEPSKALLKLKDNTAVLVQPAVKMTFVRDLHLPKA